MRRTWLSDEALIDLTFEATYTEGHLARGCMRIGHRDQLRLSGSYLSFGTGDDISSLGHSVGFRSP